MQKKVLIINMYIYITNYVKFSCVDGAQRVRKTLNFMDHHGMIRLLKLLTMDTTKEVVLISLREVPFYHGDMSIVSSS